MLSTNFLQSNRDLRAQIRSHLNVLSMSSLFKKKKVNVLFDSDLNLGKVRTMLREVASILEQTC